MKLLNRVRTQVKSDLKLLGQVLSWFDQVDSPLIPDSIWLQCQIALAEAFTNAVRYAHRTQPAETPIEIEVTLAQQALEIRIWDYGAGFDLEQFLQKVPPATENDTGGRGVRLIDKIADRLWYFRTEDQRNCLLIVKQLPSCAN